MITMPSSPEAEEAVLTAVLQGSLEALDACRNVRPSAFWSQAHANIWRAVEALEAQSEPITLVTVIARLRTMGLGEAGAESDVYRLSGLFAPAAYTPHYVELLREKEKLRSMLEIAAEIQTLAAGSDSSAEVLEKLEARLFTIGATGGEADANQLGSGVKEVLSQIELCRKGETPGVSSGLAAWDRVFGGIAQGLYHVIGGRPGAGKTAMVEQIMLHLLTRGKRVLFVSREMRKDRVIRRMACKLANVDHWRVVRRLADASELAKLEEACKAIAKTALHLVTPSEMNGVQLRSLMRRAARREAVDLLVVDYLQLLDYPPGIRDATPGVRENSKQLRAGINETGIPAIICVQLNREMGDGRPLMSHIKESGQVEQDADTIALLWREDPQNRPNEVVFSVDKNRDGRCTDERLEFEGSTMSFHEPATSLRMRAA